MNTIQEMREFIASIPAEKFTKNTMIKDGKMCVFAHINKKVYNHWDNPPNTGYGVMGRILEDNGGTPQGLINANNNHPEGPKIGAIQYLNKLILALNIPIIAGCYYRNQ